jgi:hypothetical protein
MSKQTLWRGAIVGTDKRGRSVLCDNPCCEEAGRHYLCLKHWDEHLHRTGRQAAERYARRAVKH